MKKIIVFGAAWLFCTSFINDRNRDNDGVQPQRKPLHTIIIDAGHGGRDEGAPGGYSFEKNISLAIALKLQKKVNEELPDVEVVMTRTDDSYPSLYNRADLANKSKGDLFISIHCNSADPIRHKEFLGYKMDTYYKGKGAKRKKYTRKVPEYKYYSTPNPAKGTETYIWAAHKNEAKEVAMRENESLYLDSATNPQMKDFDPESPQKRIIYSLKTQQYFERSANLAITVEDEFSKVGRISREARQRQVGIWVLQATAMPSILVETGYISNPEEEDYLNSEKGQDEIVEALVKALKRYRFSLENRQAPSITAPVVADTTVTEPVPTQN
ncbi:N-acetylmuramoyl-L-alanine amidase [Filimonas lacunae]|uniref:N-acetylmuramoyl-L-alanine amidase n=1 Tax=Filimonas lacunae TaxID=477680 RepID=A0A173ME74_9BACT|nr:N-acetylmuramoyl-L-alanine amidase [Filimonas lacunae]BAV05875.1 N-acetylmuramoyl-L-alanine amidase [Filimonas lacunae]SIT34580.1 N-acetylmuramoyl-L-alanine amidase [Filimonas lacunae]